MQHQHSLWHLHGEYLAGLYAHMLLVTTAATPLQTDQRCHDTGHQARDVRHWWRAVAMCVQHNTRSLLCPQPQACPGIPHNICTRSSVRRLPPFPTAEEQLLAVYGSSTCTSSCSSSSGGGPCNSCVYSGSCSSCFCKHKVAGGHQRALSILQLYMRIHWA